jgi:uncharacterized lipoprotein YehR (DUF1307 family)
MRSLLVVLLVFSLAGCGENEESSDQLSQKEESCNHLRQMVISQLNSRNTIDSINKEHSSEAMQSALDDADDGLDVLQAKLIKECSE